MWPIDGWAFAWDPHPYEYNDAQHKLYCNTQHDCCTSMVLRPSYAKLIQPTTRPKQTNPQPNPNTTLLRIIVYGVLRRWKLINASNLHELFIFLKYVQRDHISRLTSLFSIIIGQQALLVGLEVVKSVCLSYPGYFILCFCWLFELKINIFLFLSRSHTISNI